MQQTAHNELQIRENRPNHVTNRPNRQEKTGKNVRNPGISNRKAPKSTLLDGQQMDTI